MAFPEIVKSAMDLGVVPTLALLLVYAMYRQNRQLARDRQQIEERLLSTITQVLQDYQKLLALQFPPARAKETPHD